MACEVRVFFTVTAEFAVGAACLLAGIMMLRTGLLFALTGRRAGPWLLMAGMVLTVTGGVAALLGLVTGIGFGP